MPVFYKTYKQRNGTAIGTIVSLTWRTGNGSSQNHYQLPHGYLACDGSSVSAASYPALFDIIGNEYGGNGSYNIATKTYSGSFNLPDYRGRKLIGHGPVQDSGAQGPSNALHSSNVISSQNYHGGSLNLSSASISGAFAFSSTTTASGHTGLSTTHDVTIGGNIGFTANAPSSYSHGLVSHNHPESAGAGGYKWWRVDNKNVRCSNGGGGPSYEKNSKSDVSTPDYSVLYDATNTDEQSSSGTSVSSVTSSRQHSHWLSINGAGTARGSASSNIKGDNMDGGGAKPADWTDNVSETWQADQFVTANALTTTINSWTPQNHITASINTSATVDLTTPAVNSLWAIKAY